jgi:hypothetical protein
MVKEIIEPKTQEEEEKMENNVVIEVKTRANMVEERKSKVETI